MKINIEEYLSRDEIRDLCISEFKSILKDNERVLMNTAYSMAEAILDEVLTPAMKTTIRSKVWELIKDPSSYTIFRKKDAWEAEESPAWTEVKKAIEEHKPLIGPLVKQAMLDRDYLGDLPKSSDYIAEVIIDAIVKGMS